MTIENWLTIAVIITTLIAPTIAEFVKPRTNQPKPTPEPSQPKNRTQRIGGWFKRVLESPWYLPPFLILVNIFTLLEEFHRTTPVTRWVVYQIAGAVAGIWYGLVIFLLNTVWQAIRRQWEINHAQSETDREILDILCTVNRTQSESDREIIDLVSNLATIVHVTTESLASVERLKTEQDESMQRILRKLLAAIKRLSGD